MHLWKLDCLCFHLFSELTDIIYDTEEAESSSDEEKEESSSDEELGARVQEALKECKFIKVSYK